MTSGLAAVVAKVLLDHGAAGMNSVEGYVACWCGENVPCDGLGGDEWEDALDAEMAAHVAAEVTNALTTALTSEAVVDSVEHAVAVVMMSSANQEPWRDCATAALAAIPEALGAEVSE